MYQFAYLVLERHLVCFGNRFIAQGSSKAFGVLFCGFNDGDAPVPCFIVRFMLLRAPVLLQDATT